MGQPELMGIQKELKAKYKSDGIVRYTISASGDGRVCPTCTAHDGKTYKVADMKIGKNHPPFCEKCRCIALPGFDIPGLELPWENKQKEPPKRTAKFKEVL